MTGPMLAASNRIVALVLAGAVGLVGLVGCAWMRPGVPGCSPPKDEDALLSDYRNDPVFAIKPPDARAQGGLRTAHACKQLDYEDGSDTSVTQIFTVPGSEHAIDLRSVYDKAITSHGWSTSADGGPAVLAYCKQVRGTLSQLAISVNYGAAGTLIVAVAADPSCGHELAGITTGPQDLSRTR